MLGKVDYSGHHKFLASIGLLLIGAAALFPWLMAQKNAVLEYSSTQLESFTPVAQDAINSQQHSFSVLQEIQLSASFTLFVIGATTLLYGMGQWATRQKVVNDTEAADLRLKTIQITQAGSDEVTEEQKREIDDQLPTLDVATAENSEQAKELSERKRAALRSRQESGEKVIRLLESGFSERYSIKRNVRAGSSNTILDALLDPKIDDGHAQLGIEVKYVLDNSKLAGQIRTIVPQAAQVSAGLRSGKIYTGRAGRPPLATTSSVLIIVAENDVTDDNKKAALYSAFDSTNEQLKDPIGAIILSQDRLSKIDDDVFQALIIKAWKQASLEIA